MPRQIRLLPVLLALFAASLSAHAAPIYSVAPVGNLGGSASLPGGLNSAGTVVGYAYTPGNHINAYVSHNGGITSLHPSEPNNGNSRAAGINAGGTVVGDVGFQSGPTRAAVFTLGSEGGVRYLGTLGGVNSYGNGINDAGYVVGKSDTAGGFQHGFVTDANGDLIDIGPLNGGYTSDANAISNTGRVTGYVDINGNGDYRAYIYRDGLMEILGTLGGNYAQGYAINNAGMVAGYSYLSGDLISHAFLYADGLLTDIGGFGGDLAHATGVNEAGDVVGTGNDANGAWHAFLYSGGSFHDLNSLIDPSLGWNLNYAADINDKGQIAARGCKASGECADLLLTLVENGGDPEPNPVPEPEAFTAGIAALALLKLMRRRNRP